MRSSPLSSCYFGEIKPAEESHLVLYSIGKLNPCKITKLGRCKKVSENMKARDYVKLGILNIQKKLGKNNYSQREIRRAFAIVSKYEAKSNVSHIKCNFIINKSHSIFKKAYELNSNINRALNPVIANELNTECSKKVAPYQIDTSYTYYNSDNLRNQQLKEYLRILLKEVDNFEAK